MNYREELLEILQDINSEADYETCQDLIGEEVLTSFEMVMLVAEISQQLGISIPADQIVPENFRSVDVICELLERLAKEE